MGKRARQGYTHNYAEDYKVCTCLLLSNPTIATACMLSYNTHLSFSNPIDTVKGSVHLQGLWHHQVVYGSNIYLIILSVDISTKTLQACKNTGYVPSFLNKT